MKDEAKRKKINNRIMDDAVKVHFLSEKGIVFEHPDIVNSRKRIKELKDELDYNLNSSSNGLPFEIWIKYIHNIKNPDENER